MSKKRPFLPVFAASRPRFHKLMRSIIKFNGAGKFVIAFFLAELVLALLLTTLIFLPSATVNIKTKSEPVAIIINVRLDLNLSKLSPTLLSVPARLVTRDEYLKIGDLAEHDWVTDDRLALEGDANRKIFLYRKTNLVLLAKREIAKVLRQGWEILPDSQPKIKLQRVILDADEAGALVVATVEATAVPSLLYDKWRQEAGRRPEQLQADIESIDGVDDVKISISPRFWPFLPLRSKQIIFSADAIDTH